MQTLDHAALTQLIITSLDEVLTQTGRQKPASVDAQTALVGPKAVLDSLGLVTLIVDLERVLEEDHGLMVTMTSDRAMSPTNSPFATISSLSAYLQELISEDHAHA